VTAIPQQTGYDYHADYSAVSRSMLATFMASPVRYYRQYVTRELQPEPPTPALTFGIRVHMAVFEPERFAREFAVEPKVPHRGRNPWKKQLEAFRKANPGKEIIPWDDGLAMLKVVTNLTTSPLASKLIWGNGPAERPIYWTDAETGIPCKAKPDRLLLGKRIVVDLKTAETCDPDEFGRAVSRFGYDCQAAWYLDGLKAVYGTDFRWLLVVCEKSECFEHSIIQLTEDKIEVGRRKNREALRELRRRIDANDWSSRYSGTIFDCDVTPYERASLYERAG